MYKYNSSVLYIFIFMMHSKQCSANLNTISLWRYLTGLLSTYELTRDVVYSALIIVF